MSKDNIFDYSGTADSNSDIAGVDISGATGKVKNGDNAIRTFMSHIAKGVATRGSDVATASTLDLDAATTPSLVHDLTGTTTVTAVTLTEGHWRICRAAGAFQLTASSSLIVNSSTSVNYTTTAEDLLLFEGYSSSVVRVWVLSSAKPASTTFAGPVELATDAEAQAMSDTGRVVTPSNLAAVTASTSDMATGTSTTRFVTPGRQAYHPSACKGHVYTDAAGNIYASFNVTSITDAGVGVMGVTWATDFNSAFYTVVLGKGSNALNLIITEYFGERSATYTLVNTHNAAGAYQDPASFSVAAYGVY